MITAADAKKKCTALIKQVNVQLTKSVAMRDALDVQSLDFAPQEDIVNTTDAAEEKPSEP